MRIHLSWPYLDLVCMRQSCTLTFLLGISYVGSNRASAEQPFLAFLIYRLAETKNRFATLFQRIAGGAKHVPMHRQSSRTNNNAMKCATGHRGLAKEPCNDSGRQNHSDIRQGQCKIMAQQDLTPSKAHAHAKWPTRTCANVLQGHGKKGNAHRRTNQRAHRAQRAQRAVANPSAARMRCGDTRRRAARSSRGSSRSSTA